MDNQPVPTARSFQTLIIVGGGLIACELASTLIKEKKISGKDILILPGPSLAPILNPYSPAMKAAVALHEKRSATAGWFIQPMNFLHLSFLTMSMTHVSKVSSH